MEATFGQVEFTNGAGALKNRIRLADGPLDDGRVAKRPLQ